MPKPKEPLVDWDVEVLYELDGTRRTYRTTVSAPNVEAAQALARARFEAGQRNAEGKGTARHAGFKRCDQVLPDTDPPPAA